MNFSRCSWIFSWGSNKILWDDLPPTAYWLWICCYCFIYLNMHWWLKITSMNILNELPMPWKHHWENYFFFCFCSFSLFLNDLNTSTNVCCLSFHIFEFSHVDFCDELWKYQNDFFWCLHYQFSECFQNINSSVHKCLHPRYFRFSGNLFDSIKFTKAVHPNNGVRQSGFCVIVDTIQWHIIQSYINI